MTGKLLAYHLKSPRVPLVVRVPQFENHCSKASWFFSHKKGVLQPLHWRCAECAVHHEQNVREEQHHTYVARTSNNRVISSGERLSCTRLRILLNTICGKSGFN